MFTSGWGKGTRFVACFLLALFLVSSAGVQAQVESGDVGLTATVEGLPPPTAPNIAQPTPGEIFEEKNIGVGGTCLAGLIVKVFSNAIFIGSTVCDAGGNYNLSADLFLDRNDLVARQYDLLDQASPDSNTVTVYFVPPSVTPEKPGDDTQTSTPADDQPVANFLLVIDYDYTAQGVFAEKPLRLPVRFVGGTSPYTVTIDWGDGSDNSYERQDTSVFTVEYAYDKPGLRIVTVRVKDSAGQSAYLQFVVIVHGQVDSPVSKGLAEVTYGPIAFVIVFTPFIIGLLLGALIVFIAGRFRRRQSQEKA